MFTARLELSVRISQMHSQKKKKNHVQSLSLSLIHYLPLKHTPYITFTHTPFSDTHSLLQGCLSWNGAGSTTKEWLAESSSIISSRPPSVFYCSYTASLLLRYFFFLRLKVRISGKNIKEKSTTII